MPPVDRLCEIAAARATPDSPFVGKLVFTFQSDAYERWTVTGPMLGSERGMGETIDAAAASALERLEEPGPPAGAGATCPGPTRAAE
jgi:hypothetical protein